MTILAILPVNEVLPLLGKEKSMTVKRPRYVNHKDKNLEVSLESNRILTFWKSGIRCVECGIEGKYFIVGLAKKVSLGLYTIDEYGAHIPMTSDHIIPKSKGGSNSIDNRQTMCEDCNIRKSDTW